MENNPVTLMFTSVHTDFGRIAVIRARRKEQTPQLSQYPNSPFCSFYLSKQPFKIKNNRFRKQITTLAY